MRERIRCLVDDAVQDAAYAARTWRRSPGFTAAAIFALALGIGMNTAIFSAVHAVLLKPLDYPSAERLVWLAAYDPNIQRDVVSVGDFAAWREQARSYDAMAAYGYQQAAVSWAGRARQVNGVVIAGDFWKLTGSTAALGSLFAPSAQEWIVLTHELFERDFGGDPRIVGGTVLVEGRPATVAGVLPASFRFQFPMWWASTPTPVEAFFPLQQPDIQRGRLVNVAATLRRGIGAGEAQAELHAIERRIVAESRRISRLGQLRVEPLAGKLSGEARTPLLVLLAAGAFVLLIACANIANLLLARAAARRREIALRAAMGAGTGRVLRQLITESTLLSLAGGAAGLLVARWMISASVRISPQAAARLMEATIDLPVLGFTLAVAVAAGVLFGCAPLAVVSRTDLHGALKDGGRASDGSSGQSLRKLLIACEAALATVLLTGAGLMLLSFYRMHAWLTGFAPETVVTLKVRLAGPSYTDEASQERYIDEMLRRLEAEPGVTAAGVSNWSLFGGAPAFPSDSSRTATHVVRLNAASPGYPKAVGMRLVKGRWLAASDPASAVLLNESMARRAFGAVDPVGRQLSVPHPMTVVGVVSDLRYSQLDAEPPPEVYVPYQQLPFLRGADVAVRTTGSTAAMVPAIRKLVSDIDPTQPVYDVRSLEQALDASIAPRRFRFFLLGTFAAAALLLALAGIYASISYWVAQRTREIAVRVVLGARPAAVARMVILEGAGSALAGLAAGMAAAWGLARFMEGFAYGVTVHDPRVFAGAGIGLAVGALASVALPALRAARADPVASFRHE